MIAGRKKRISASCQHKSLPLQTESFLKFAPEFNHHHHHHHQEVSWLATSLSVEGIHQAFAQSMDALCILCYLLREVNTACISHGISLRVARLLA